MENKKRIAVVTGASSGMGREFALRIDGEESFDEIWLIARRTERLEEIARVCKNPARAISMDLTKSEAWDEYKRMLESENADVRVLVNAAGFGYFKGFLQMDLERQLAMIDLNDKALIAMTYHTLAHMSDGGKIYQLGSLSSFQPVPFINVYGASKAFVLSFSRALNRELKSAGRKIRVMAVCPGWVLTEFFDTAVSDDTISYYNRYYTSEQVITRALRDMKKGKDVSICGFPVRAQVLGVKLLPHKTVMNVWCKQQKKK